MSKPKEVDRIDKEYNNIIKDKNNYINKNWKDNKR